MAPFFSVLSVTASGAVAGNFSGLYMGMQPLENATVAPSTKTRKFDRIGNALQVGIEVIKHLIGGLDGLSAHLIGTLHLNHVDHFFNHVDVRALGGALLERAEP